MRVESQADEQGWALRFYGFTLPVDITGRDALHTVNKVMPAINTIADKLLVPEKTSELENLKRKSET